MQISVTEKMMVTHNNNAIMFCELSSTTKHIFAIENWLVAVL